MKDLYQVHERKWGKELPCSMPLPIETGSKNSKLDGDEALKFFKKDQPNGIFFLKKVDQKAWKREFLKRNKIFLRSSHVPCPLKMALSVFDNQEII